MNELERLFTDVVQRQGWGWGIFRPSINREYDEIVSVSSLTGGGYYTTDDGLKFSIDKEGPGSELLSGLCRWMDAWSDGVNGGVSVNLFYIDSPRFEVHSFVVAGHEFIGISNAAIHILKFIYNKALATREVLSTVGNPKVEVHNLSAWPENYKDIVLKNKMFVPSFPNDYVRSGYADFLTSVAIHFLVAHEFAHLSAGHPLAKQKIERSDSASVTDNIYEKVESEHNVMSQMLESEADIGAFNIYALDKIANREKYRVQQHENDLMNARGPVIDEIWSSDESLIKAISFSIFLMFRFMDYDSQERKDKERNVFSYTHPPFVIRARSIERHIQHKYKRLGFGGVRRRRMAKIVNGSLHEAAISFSRIVKNNNPWDSKFFTEEGGQEYERYLDKMKNAYFSAAPIVDKYRRFRHG